MSTGVQQPSARLCFFTAGLLHFKSNSYSFCDAYCHGHTGRRPERAIGFLLASPSGRRLEQTCDSDLQLALIHLKHAKPSRSPISITWKSVERRRPDSDLGCRHNSLCMSRRTASFSIVPQLILTLHIPPLTSRSPAYHRGHLNWVTGIVVATRAFQSAHLLILPFTTILYVLQKSNRM